MSAKQWSLDNFLWIATTVISFSQVVSWENLFGITFKMKFLEKSYLQSDVILVGYDEKKMLLSGKFDYDKENQRTLPFNVDIRDLPAYKTVFTGSSSKIYRRNLLGVKQSERSQTLNQGKSVCHPLFGLLRISRLNKRLHISGNKNLNNFSKTWKEKCW